MGRLVISPILAQRAVTRSRILHALTISMTNACLFQSLQLGDIIIQNRIGMSAVTRRHVPNAIPSDLMTEYDIQRTLGMAGLIMIEGILVTRQGTELPHTPGNGDPEQTRGIVHRGGRHIYAQLCYVGRAARSVDPEQKLAGTPVYATSAFSAIFLAYLDMSPPLLFLILK